MTLNDVALPDDYSALLADLKAKIGSARQVAIRTVNTQLIALYWTIGQSILDRQAEQGWGAKVIDRLASDLRAESPDMTGLSRSNLKYMRQFAAAWSDPAIGQQLVGQLPWGHVTVLLGKLNDRSERDWYAARAVEHSWSRNILLNQIKAKTHLRVGAAPSNFASALPAETAEKSQALTKDPYALEFLGLTQAASEHQLEDALVSRLKQTLQEFGSHLAFVGRQHHLEVGGQDYFIDLLFFDVVHLRYVVFELRIGAFEPEFAGKLAFYVSAVDDLVRLQDKHEPTIGILLCADANRTVVQSALHGTTIADGGVPLRPAAPGGTTGAPVGCGAHRGGHATGHRGRTPDDPRGRPRAAPDGRPGHRAKLSAWGSRLTIFPISGVSFTCERE